MPNFISSCLTNKSFVSHQLNLQNINYLQSNLKSVNFKPNKNPKPKCKNEGIISIINNNKHEHINKKINIIADQKDTISICLPKIKNFGKKHSIHINTIDNGYDNITSVNIQMNNFKINKPSVKSNSIYICSNDQNTLDPDPSIHIPYCKNKRKSIKQIHISTIENDFQCNNIQTIHINEPFYKILKELEFFAKNQIIPDFVLPYNNKQFDKIEKNIHNGVFDKYLHLMDNKKYNNISIATIIKKLLCLIKNNISYDTEIIELNETIKILNKKITDLELNGCSNKSTYLNIKTELSSTITINQIYVIYIQRYGIPDYGLFDEEKLEQIEEELEEEHHHHHDDHC